MNKKSRIRLLSTAIFASLALAVLLFGVSLAANGTGFVIDTFTVPEPIKEANPSNKVKSAVVNDPGPGVNILGGQRDSVVTHVSGMSVVELGVQSEQLIFATGGMTLGTAQMAWDGVDNDPLNVDKTGLGGVDLTDGGTKDGFQLQIVFDDDPVDVTLRVYSDASNWSERTLNLPGFIFSPVSYFVPFSDFAGGQGTTDFTDVGAVVLFIDGTLTFGTDLAMKSIQIVGGEGTGTPGYWVNHPEAWPVDPIMIGGVEYTKADAIKYMAKPVRRDKTFTMFPALVAAKLNVLKGTDASCIADTIAAADAWMADHPVESGVKGSSEAWEAGEPLYELLDMYNNGMLCAPPRD